ncbi:MAG: hypothetical protein KIS67_00280 [Verrucomicrobiae bacterium]|nr:hypothetical protein [Verrucomicrobiae bacterium]
MNTKKMPNQVTGPNAGGPRQLPIPTSLAARVGQFCRCRFTMRSVLIIVLASAGLFGCTREERTFTAAQQVLSGHFDAVRAGDTNALLARYSPEFFRQPKRSREQQVGSLARLHAEGLHDYTIVHRELRDHSTGTLVRFSCRSRYGSVSFEEDFELYRPAGTTNFVITSHDFD